MKDEFKVPFYTRWFNWLRIVLGWEEAMPNKRCKPETQADRVERLTLEIRKEVSDIHADVHNNGNAAKIERLTRQLAESRSQLEEVLKRSLKKEKQNGS